MSQKRTEFKAHQMLFFTAFFREHQVYPAAFLKTSLLSVIQLKLDFSVKEEGIYFSVTAIQVKNDISRGRGSKGSLDQCSPFRSLSLRNHSQTPGFLRDSMLGTASAFTSFRSDTINAQGSRATQDLTDLGTDAKTTATRLSRFHTAVQLKTKKKNVF